MSATSRRHQSSENDEAAEMAVFLADAQTGVVLDQFRGQQQSMMDQTPPGESRLLRFLREDPPAPS